MPTKTMHLKPVETNSVLKDKVYQALKSAIASMDIYADDTETKLDERRLAEELGVSRTPVREALTLLEKEGLVRMIPRRGAFVVRKTKREILEMICVWGGLESLAARLATVHASGEEIVDLRRSFVGSDDSKRASAAIDEYSRENIRFHRAIIALSKCQLLSAIADGLFIHMSAMGARCITRRDRLFIPTVDHLPIIEALEKRDAALAEQLVREHAEQLSDQVRQQVNWIE